ncbi:MAG TPA: hypothetical protein VGL23_22240 [Chloroflexota bacterium]
MRRLALILIVGLVALWPTPSSGQAPEKQRQFVWGLNSFNGVDFSTGFAPRSVDTIYVLADQESAIDPKRTDVYFWPITNEYRGDFGTVNEIVPGTLEIVRDGRVVATEPLSDYLLQFDRAREWAGGKIFFRDQARAQRQAFEDERASYVRRMHEYSDAMDRFNDDLEAIRKRADAGEKIDRMPDVPFQPADFTLFSTDLLQGFRIKLGAGEYRIRVRSEDGQIVPDSQKRLVAIAPRRQGIGYKVVPAEKWTAPEQANDPAAVLYTVPSGTVYLKPYATAEYNALEYARLQNPQDLQATANRWTWVQIAPISDVTLSLRGGGAERRAALDGFSVVQIPGPALGYAVVPFERRPGDPPPGSRAERSPDLVAFKVDAPPGGGLETRLLDGQGREIAGSARTVIATPARGDWQFALPVLAPVLLGLTAVLWRREQLQSIRSLPPEKRQLVA